VYGPYSIVVVVMAALAALAGTHAATMQVSRAKRLMACMKSLLIESIPISRVA
jgi:hypothetical protein